MQSNDDVTRKATIVLSSFKNSFGKEELFDESTEKYWSSDGKAPHFVVAKFTQLTCLKEIHLYLDYDRDESYTPNRIYLKAGYDEYSSVAIFESDIVKPKGWICVLIDENISALYYQILFPYNYLNGKDLRIRGLRLMGLVADEFTGSSKEQNEDSDLCLLSERASCPASPTIIR